MRYYGFLILIALMTLTPSLTPCSAATFGTVVPVGGQASDEALDETRGLLYIANFTANRIDVMSTATNTIQTSINVAAQPGSLALSRDAQYLLVAHFNNSTPPVPGGNLLTLIHLPDNAQQTFVTVDPPLGVAFFATVPANGASNFSGPGMALVVTTTGFYTLDPTTGLLTVVSTLTNVAATIPATVPTFPGQIIQTALSTSGDGTVIWGIGGATTGSQVIYQFHAQTGSQAERLSAFGWVTSPPLLPRVSVAYDGSSAMVGWMLLNSAFEVQARYPGPTASTNVTGHAIDSRNGLIYGQIPDSTTPLGPPYTSSNASSATTAAAPPELLVMANDNLTVNSRLLIQEDIVGRMILNSAGTSLYAISDSGVTVFPVGSLNQAHRLVADHEDLLVATTFCNRAVVAQSMVISDPGGNQTDFTITSSQPGVKISPASGMTPATVTVTVDPSQFQSLGTVAVTLNISSVSAVNVPASVRLLVNNPDEYQRGTVVDVPGTLTDVMADPARNRFYVVRQDKNQLEVFDGSTNQMIVALRTATTPTLMTMSNDGNYLLVANDNSQLVSVFDLNALQPVSPVVLPFSHFGHSVASSNNAILVLANNNATNTGVIDTVNLQAGTASQLTTLGIWQNELSTTAVLANSPNGASILVADPGGTVMLYSAAANTFTVARKDFTSLSGAFAASSYNTFVVGDNILNPSLVPQGILGSPGTTAGFYFTGQGGYQVAAHSQSTAGVIQNLPALTGAQSNPTSMVEAPVLPSTAINFTRTVAPLSSAGTVIALTTSGVTVLSANYAAATTPPAIASVQNAANGSTAVAPGGLISVYGSQLSATNIATSQIPLPTAMGESCLVVNGTPIPLLFVSSGQVNGQLPLNMAGNVSANVHTPAGVSNNFNFTVASAAPAVFLSGAAGPETGLATIFRYDNGQLVTPTNPLHPGDTVIIYLTGMGLTSPEVQAGQQTPPTLLTQVTQTAAVTLGTSNLNVSYAGLAPGYVSGLYQINATLPNIVAAGDSVPLVITQAGGSTTLNVRVVN